MTRTPARPDLQAHHNAIRLDPAVLVKELRDLLGAKLVAYLGGVKEAATHPPRRSTQRPGRPRRRCSNATSWCRSSPSSTPPAPSCHPGNRPGHRTFAECTCLQL